MRGALLEAALWVGAALLLVLGFRGDGSAGEIDLTRPAADYVLRVVTWNVGGASGLTGSALADEHLEAVAATLKELDADLCFLQELRSERQVNRLELALGLGWRAAAGGARGRHVACFVRGGEVRRLELPGRGRASDRELFAAVRMDSGVKAAFGVVHAHAYSARRRNELLGAAVDRLVALGHEGLLLLAGDFNLDLDLDKRRDLFTDDDHLDVETYNYVAGRFVDAALGTGSTAEPDRRLDYVFVDPATAEVEAAGVVRDRRLGDMDHDPVVVDVRSR